MVRQINTKLLYSSNMDFKWMIQKNHIKNSDGTVRDIEVTQQIWGNNIDALKGKTTWTKPNPVAEYIIKIPKYMPNLKKTVFLTVGQFYSGYPTKYSFQRIYNDNYFVSSFPLFPPTLSFEW